MSEQRLPPEVQQLIAQYQAMRESYVKVDSELKLVEAEISEIDNVLENLQYLQDSTEVYKLIGQVLVKKSKDEVVKELQERKELLSLKKEKYRKQLEVLSRQLADLESKIREVLSKYGFATQKQT
ncbi:prefoldin, beta subunit [Thermogladius calderae 1633]|uniref:Prefoldin subunit beta n=1 Tax=Thermogladius calderae (strain DSM 22663 / VKM B-2946 / 1633) TaxID=1184251 RepID=I3TDK4_THEC1|nr:prefoldin subunit beta [Thermogladius calderae]AFK50842.1 prefoldin, beta subunit [Thermogladius calderae 1633]